MESLKIQKYSWKIPFGPCLLGKHSASRMLRFESKLFSPRKFFESKKIFIQLGFSEAVISFTWNYFSFWLESTRPGALCWAFRTLWRQKASLFLFILASSPFASVRWCRNHAVDIVRLTVWLNAVVIANQKIKSLYISSLQATTCDKLHKFHSFDPVYISSPSLSLPYQHQSRFPFHLMSL